MIRNFRTARLPASVVLLSGALILLSLLLLLFSGPGYRWGWWDFNFGFALLNWGVYIAIPGALLGLMIAPVVWKARGPGWALLLSSLTVIVGCGIVGKGLLEKTTAERLPRICDITTDLVSPPQFAAVLGERGTALNTVADGDPEIASLQRQAYPEVQPLSLPLPPEQVFPTALRAAEFMGWKIVASVAPERIEATDTTFWFGFKDDVVIRVRAEGAGTRIDVRSASRLDQSDGGRNAHRIQAYLGSLVE